MEEVSWPYFDIVITDWSWAFMYAIIIEWNNTNIHDYIRRTCRYVTHGEPYPEKWIIVHSCAVHFLKRVSDKIDDLHKSFAGKDFVMDCTALMIQCKNLKELDAVFERMMTVLVTPCEHEARNAREELDEMRLKEFGAFTSEKDEGVRQNGTEKLKSKEKNEDTIYKDSPFHSRYSEKLKKINDEVVVSDDAPTNQFQCVPYAEYAVDQHMPFAPMWSAILISKNHPEIGRLHNQHNEAHFHVVKETVLENKKDMPIGRVVKRLKHY